MELVLGIDAGGTTSRCALHTMDGTLVGYGRSAAGNPYAGGAATAVANLATAARQALGAVDPADVRAAVAGVAGFSHPTGELDELWTGLGLLPAPRLVPDAVVAFSAGTPEPSGTVLIAGTGAIAAAISDHAVTAVADGYGWLLGDTGSGFWLGRRAVGTALDVLRHGSPPYGPLTRDVIATLLGDAIGPLGPHLVDEVIRAANTRAPVSLADLAPVVFTAAGAGDPLARQLLDDAARNLVETASKVRAPGQAGPIVLAGSVLTRSAAVSALVRRDLARRWTAVVTIAGDAARAAAWLAARDLVTDPLGRYARFMRTETAASG